MDSKYKYTYEKTANYCYKGTDVLINNLFKENSCKIAEEERLKYIEIYCLNKIN